MRDLVIVQDGAPLMARLGCHARQIIRGILKPLQRFLRPEVYPRVELLDKLVGPVD